MAAARAAGADSGNTNGGLDVAAAAASAAALWKAEGSSLDSPSSLVSSSTALPTKALQAVPEHHDRLPPTRGRSQAPRSVWRGAGPKRR